MPAFAPRHRSGKRPGTSRSHMAIRIRVHPQIGGAFGGAYGMMGAVSPQQYYQQELQNEKDTSNLRLQYERALWQEKLKSTQLSSALQYGSQQPMVSPYGALGLGLGGQSLLGN